MLVHDLPESGRVGISRHAFKHQSGRPVRKRAVKDIAVTGDPPDIRRTPINISIVVIEHIAVCHRRIQLVAARGVQHSLGFSSRSRRIKDKQRILRCHRLSFTLSRDFRHGFVVPHVSITPGRDGISRSSNHNGRMHLRAPFQSLFHVGLQRNRFPAPRPFVCCDHHAAI